MARCDDWFSADFIYSVATRMWPAYRWGKDAPSVSFLPENKSSQHACAIRGGFLLVRFLWPFKENELVCPDETGHQNPARASESN